MIPGIGPISTGGGGFAPDLSAGPSTSGNISQGGFSFAGPNISGTDWKQTAVLGAVVLVVLVLALKK